mgnify:FL=1
MKIALSKSEYMDDWYAIVKAQPIVREWMERTTPNCYRFMASERLSPEACIEGTAEQMLALARAIQLREAVSFKRCAVHFEADGVHFSSPKNSERDAVVSVEDAEEFAAHVLAKLRGAEPLSAEGSRSNDGLGP